MPRGFVRTALSTATVIAALAVPAGAATIEVTVTNDELNADADCSLREAVQAANTNSAVSGCPKGQGSKRDTVKLQPGEFYQLTIASTNEDANLNGDIDLTGGGPVTIKGNSRGMGGPEINAPASDRAIDALGTDAVKIQKLNLEGGDVSGLGLAGGNGGVVSADDTPLKIDDVNLEHGNALDGGAIFASGSNLTISDSFLGQNDAEDEGGGIFAIDMKRLKATRSGVDSNDVVATNARGGGIWTNADRTQIIDTEVTFNGVETTDANGLAVGGGIHSTSELLQIRRSLIEGNDAADVGGASSSFGGGVNSLGAEIEAVNSTFFGNDVDGSGGAIHSRAGSVSHVTFSTNDAGDEGDHMNRVSGQGPLKLRNSIIPGVVFTDLCAGDPGAFVSKGYSVIQFDDPTCAFLDSDAVVTDIGFADGTPLPNGGETFTMGIEKDSPAKDLIPKRKCKVAQKEDQRDFRRPKGKKCDAGAFERGAKP